MIIIAPLWIWLTALPLLLSIRVASLIVRVLLAAMRLAWRIMRRSASVDREDEVRVE